VSVDGDSSLDLRALRGRVWIADFIYTRCSGPCPMLSANMAGLQKRLPPSIGLLSFTVDPDHDSVELLTVYAHKFGADAQRWFFVTGDKSALLKLFRDGFQIAVAQSAAAAPGQNIAHTTKFILIDGAGRLRGYYDGDDAESLDRLAADAKRL
jgi:protein SCO1/2